METSWKKVVHDLRISPDEGLCIDVLHTAGRNGLPTLATDVIRALTELKVTLQEHHFSPVVEAFAAAGMIKNAFNIISVMASGDITPVTETTYPILKVIGKNLDVLESACTAVEELHDEGKGVHVTALNCVIKASVAQGDLQRAIGVYNSFSSFGIKATAETFTFLLEGCVAASARELGDKLLVEMKQAAIVPDAQTYERLIQLCLTQTTYEDAFFYLEEMKSLTMVPTSSIYEALVRKCVSMGDTRFKLAVEEMKDFGHRVSSPLQAFIDSGGEVTHEESEEPSTAYGEHVNRIKRLQFVQNARN